MNEFCNPDLFPMMYPTLFPYGLGGFENTNDSELTVDGPQQPQHKTPLSLKQHVKHLFSLSDKQFQEHYSFLFTTFNILQQHEILLRSSLKVKKSSFDETTTRLASVSFEAMHSVMERVSRGDYAMAHNDKECKVLQLMKEVKVITSSVLGSSALRLAMRNEIRGMMTELGMPSFYIMINPADVYNLLVKFLAGDEIDIYNLLPKQVPKYWDQSILVACNPALAAQFFNIYMKAFVFSILGYDPKHQNLDGGTLGHVKGYYGCVEAQGCGTLHCHMMVWVEGGLIPNEIRDRVIKENDTEFAACLIQFLDDTISNKIPDNPGPDVEVTLTNHHLRCIPGVNFNTTPTELLDKVRQKDLHHLAKQSQSHAYPKTCYKYWKGPPEPKECQFDLDEPNVRAESTFNSETGDLCLRCLDGLVNNFNEMILEAVRCNMDIKFIGSGTSAKAILYYITDYNTKSQLKTQVAFAALELAIRHLGEYDPHDDNQTI